MLTELSKHDLERWLAALVTQPIQPDQLMEWVDGPLREFFPFRQFMMIYGELVAGEIKITHWLQSGFTGEYLHQFATSFELPQRGLLAWWLANRQPFYVDPLDPPPYLTPFEAKEIEHFSLGRLAAHGVLNVKASAGTHFVFCGLPEAAPGWYLDALRVIAPILNDLFLAYVATHQASPLDLARLTPRQMEIVRHVATGTDDKTIARALSISQKTVRNQLTQVYSQLGVHRRTQLISMLR